MINFHIFLYILYVLNSALKTYHLYSRFKMANSDGSSGYNQPGYGTSLFNLDHREFVQGNYELENQSGLFETNGLENILNQNEPVKNFMANMKLKLIGVPWRKNIHSQKGTK